MPPSCPPDLDDDPLDEAELTAERDAYAAEAQALRRQLAEANAREIFLNATISDLRAELAARERLAVSA